MKIFGNWNKQAEYRSNVLYETCLHLMVAIALVIMMIWTDLRGAFFTSRFFSEPKDASVAFSLFVDSGGGRCGS